MVKKSRALHVISSIWLEKDHHLLHGPVLFPSHCAFTSVCKPERLCSWSKSVIISSPPPRLHSLSSLTCLCLYSLVQSIRVVTFFHYFPPPIPSRLPGLYFTLKTCKNITFIPPFINHYLIFFWFYSSSDLFPSVCTYLRGQLCLWLLCNHSCCYYVHFPLSGFAS